MTDITPIIQKISNIVQDVLYNNYKLYLFGSRTRERYDDKTDIDIGIQADSLINARQMFTIKEKVEEIPTLLKIDVVDFAAVSNDFRIVAMKHAREITE